MEGNLESALRRAACWGESLYARLPSGEEVYVGLSTTNERVYITRTDGDYRVEASADLPSHLVEDVT